MATSSVIRKQISPAVLVAAIITVLLVSAGAWYLAQPRSPVTPQRPSAEALAYLPQLHITDETVKAADNLMRQQVVYVDGKITNGGRRSITRLDVYCLFKDVNGAEVFRERASLVQAKTVQSATAGLLVPGQTRAFELPFDNLPDSWNQGMPNLVIAQIQFAK